MNSKSSPVVRVSRRFISPAEDVFDAWLNPLRAMRWLFATRMGRMVRAEIDARVGGRYYMTERRGKEEVEHTGKYLEMDRPRRLVFTLSVPKYSPNTDRVTVEITSAGTGCELTVAQEMKPEFAEFARRTEGGWLQMMEALAAFLDEPGAATNRKPGLLTVPGEIRFVRILPGPIERVWAYLTEDDKRAKWFAGGPMELRVGGRAVLRFHHANLAPGETPPVAYKEAHDPGITSTSRILRCEPPKVLSFSWDDEPGRQSSEVTFELSPQGEDVQLVLTHRKVSGKTRADVGAGWHLHLSLLVAHLAGRKAPLFWTTHAQLEAEYTKREEQTPAAVSTAAS
jgi:uncharacterized protein YndB with AHSA1/START domain